MKKKQILKISCYCPFNQNEKIGAQKLTLPSLIENMRMVAYTLENTLCLIKVDRVKAHQLYATYLYITNCMIHIYITNYMLHVPKYLINNQLYICYISLFNILNIKKDDIFGVEILDLSTESPNIIN